MSYMTIKLPLQHAISDFEKWEDAISDFEKSEDAILEVTPSSHDK